MYSARLAEMESSDLPAATCETVSSINECLAEVGAPASLGSKWSRIVHTATKHVHELVMAEVPAPTTG